SAASRSIISASVAIPAVRQKRSKLAPTSRQASSTPDATAAVGVISFFMALLSFADSTPRAYTGSRRATPPPYFNNGRDIPITPSPAIQPPHIIRSVWIPEWPLSERPDHRITCSGRNNVRSAVPINISHSAEELGGVPPLCNA